MDLGFWQANGSKEAFRKYMESVLQKQAKLRSLKNDLEKNFRGDEHAQKLPDPHINSQKHAAPKLARPATYGWLSCQSQVRSNDPERHLDPGCRVQQSDRDDGQG